jgi:hypothetical protein
MMGLKWTLDLISRPSASLTLQPFIFNEMNLLPAAQRA